MHQISHCDISLLMILSPINARVTADCLKNTEKCLTLNGSQMFSVEGIGDQESEMVSLPARCKYATTDAYSAVGGK